MYLSPHCTTPLSVCPLHVPPANQTLSAGVVGIYKTSTIPNVSRSTDFTYGTAIVLIWLVAEVTATIIASSIPLLRPLIRRSSSRTGRNESYGLSIRTNHGHNKLGSQAVVNTDLQNDYNSDKDILGPNSKIIRKTNITVEYDNYSADEERGEQRHGHGHEHRDVF